VVKENFFGMYVLNLVLHP